MTLRFATAADTRACLAIYAQYIDTSITFETVLPSEAEFSGRIASYGAVYPWLIAEEDGRVLAYAYAHRAQERAAYGWNAELSVYVSRDAAGRGLGSKLYGALLALLRAQGVRTAARCTKRWASVCSARITKAATKTARGATWYGLKSTSARLTASRRRSSPSAGSTPPRS